MKRIKISYQAKESFKMRPFINLKNICEKAKKLLKLRENTLHFLL